jgi:hypothetical protein
MYRLRSACTATQSRILISNNMYYQMNVAKEIILTFCSLDGACEAGWNALMPNILITYTLIVIEYPAQFKIQFIVTCEYQNHWTLNLIHNRNCIQHHPDITALVWAGVRLMI